MHQCLDLGIKYMNDTEYNEYYWTGYKILNEPYNIYLLVLFLCDTMLFQETNLTYMIQNTKAVMTIFSITLI